MKTLLSFLIVIAFLTACSNSKESLESNNLNGKALAKDKCSICHNIDMPPKFSDNEKAPPFFTVTVHLKDWIKAPTKTEAKAKFIEFVSSYPLNPSLDKAYCDKTSLKKYGLMPSLKGKVKKDELIAIANFMYESYEQKAFMEYMQEQERLKKLPLYQQVLETHDCKLCHNNPKVAPSFAQIGKRYAHKAETIRNSILNGSKGKWKEYHVAMHGYKDISKKQLDAITKWIIKEGEKEK